MTALAAGQPAGGLYALEFFELAAQRMSDGAPVTSFLVAYNLIYTCTSSGPAIESSLGLYTWDGNSWTEESSVLDTANNRLSASLDHMTLFSVMGEAHRIALPLVRR
ncbi:MAG: hypothetical protein PHS96_14565 [Anaerolineales bacterium]|nr:hypothetical protein [Anaerolineales bacterium]